MKLFVETQKTNDDNTIRVFSFNQEKDKDLGKKKVVNMHIYIVKDDGVSNIEHLRFYKRPDPESIAYESTDIIQSDVDIRNVQFEDGQFSLINTLKEVAFNAVSDIRFYQQRKSLFGMIREDEIDKCSIKIVEDVQEDDDGVNYIAIVRVLNYDDSEVSRVEACIEGIARAAFTPTPSIDPDKGYNEYILKNISKILENWDEEIM